MCGYTKWVSGLTSSVRSNLSSRNQRKRHTVFCLDTSLFLPHDPHQPELIQSHRCIGCIAHPNHGGPCRRKVVMVFQKPKDPDVDARCWTGSRQVL